MHDASTRARATGAVIGDGFIRQLVERAGADIGFELSIPHGSIKHGVPATELGEFLLRKALDLPFELLDLGHALSIP